MGKTNFSMHFDTVEIYLTVLEKEQHKNIYNTKNMQHILQPHFLSNMLRRKYLLTAFLNLPVEEEVSNQGKIQCILPQQSQQTRQKKPLSNAVNAWVTIQRHLSTNICLRLESEQSQETAGGRECVYQQEDVRWSEPRV